jgi:lipopolysaccharide transport system ATP-binding protein
MKKVLEVKNVTKIYKIYKSHIDRLKEIFLKKTYHKEFTSNKNISFDLYEGETLGIIGVNGAGKSTILKIIAGVTEPTYGDIIRHGKVTALLELGTGFNPLQTGYENIYLNGSLIGLTQKQIDNKLQKIIDFSELGDYIYEPIQTYSSGMKMRLAFSIAIFSEPQILIVDEALSVGDAHFSAKCTKALKERKEQNMSIIYVSHDLNSLKLLCDKVILLKEGSIVKEGVPSEVTDYYMALISDLDNADIKQTKKFDEVTSTESGTKEATFKDIKLFNSKNIESKVLNVGENVELHFYVKVNAVIKSLVLGCGIKDKFGQMMFGTNTFRKDQVIESPKVGKTYHFRVLFPMNLAPGSYSVHASLVERQSHVDKNFNWIDGALVFDVVNADKYKFVGLLWNNMDFIIEESEIDD